MVDPSLSKEALQPILAELSKINRTMADIYPGIGMGRQPVHVVYGGAHLFRADTAQKLQTNALRSFELYAPNAATFAAALDLSASLKEQQDWLARTVYERVKTKLLREAVEDFRIDFEDGFGIRPESEEDACAVSAAEEVGRGLKAGSMPPFFGIRVKSLSEESKHRALRTLDLFVTTMVQELDGKLPEGFVITLPKVTHPGQVAGFVRALSILERALGLNDGAIKVELMVETAQSIMNDDGLLVLPLLIKAGGHRTIGVHFGTYDYTASLDITASHQSMTHPACDFARSMMQVAYSGRNLALSDGATNIMPVAPHRDVEAGQTTALSPPEIAARRVENERVVHRAWRIAFGHISSSLRNGFYQGWDLHPAQLPVRYAACYAFFLDGLKPATDRLKSFVERAAQATLLGDVFDDAATGQGLLNYFLRALNCGAIGSDEVAATGLTEDEIKTKSFLKILEGRRHA